MDFQTSYSNSNGMITFLTCTIVSSYLQGANVFYNITAQDPVKNNYTGVMTRSVLGEFIITQLNPV